MNALRSPLPTRIAALLLALGTLAPSALQAQADGWLQVGFDSGLSWSNPDETTLSTDNVAGLRSLWTVRLSRSYAGAPTEAGGVLYVCSNTSNLSALDVATGQSLWSTSDLARGRCGATTLTSDSVLVATSAWDTSVNSLSAYDRQTGALRWRTSIAVEGSYGFKDPTLSGDTVYVADGRGALFAFDAASGSERWRAHTGLLNNQVSVGAGLVFVSTWGYGFSEPLKLFAFDASTGERVWDAELDESGAQYPAMFADGRVFVGTNDGRVYAFEAASGEKLWEASPTGNWVSAELAIEGESLFVITGVETTVLALDARTGAERWRHARSRFEESTSNMVVAQGVLYLTTDSYFDTHRLVTLSSATGEPIAGAQRESADGYGANVVVSAGRVLLASNAGGVQVFGLPPENSEAAARRALRR